jgi:hypothetical protein
MYSLIWQSVMWRPGKVRFLIGMKNRFHIQPAAIARPAPHPGRPLSLDSRLRSGYALPGSQTQRLFLIQIDAPFSP